MADELFLSHSLDKSKDSEGITTTGSYSYWSDSPVSEFDIGDKFQPVGALGPTLRVTKVSISDNVVGMKDGRPFRQWHVSIEGTASGGSGETSGGDDDYDTNAKYTFDISKDDDGIVTKSGTMEVKNDGDEPIIKLQIGQKFIVPGVSARGANGKYIEDIIVTSVSGSDEYTDNGAHRWTVTYSGAKTDVDSNVTPTDESDSVSYEINGTSTRSVAGAFVVLRRSASPVTKRSLTRYSTDGNPLTDIGGKYPKDTGVYGLATSEKVTHEIVKKDGVTIGEYYRHDIEVEK